MSDKFKSIGIGTSSDQESWDTLPIEIQNGKFPPFKVSKSSANHYEVTLAVPGVEEKDISISLHDMVLKVQLARTAEPFYDGLSRDLYMVFLVDRSFHMDSAKIDNGILTMKFSSLLKEKRSLKVDFMESMSVEIPKPSSEKIVEKVIEKIVEVEKVVEKENPVVAAPVELPTVVVPKPVVPISSLVDPNDKSIVYINKGDMTLPCLAVSVPDSLDDVMRIGAIFSGLVKTVSDEPQGLVNLVTAGDVHPSETQVVVDVKGRLIIFVLRKNVSEMFALNGVNVEDMLRKAFSEKEPATPEITAVTDASVENEIMNPITVIDIPEQAVIVEEPMEVSEVVAEEDEPVVEITEEVVSEVIAETPEPVVEEVIEHAEAEVELEPVVPEPVAAVEVAPTEPVMAEAEVVEVVEATKEVEAPTEPKTIVSDLVASEPVISEPVVDVSEAADAVEVVEELPVEPSEEVAVEEPVVEAEPTVEVTEPVETVEETAVETETPTMEATVDEVPTTEEVVEEPVVEVVEEAPNEAVVEPEMDTVSEVIEVTEPVAEEPVVEAEPTVEATEPVVEVEAVVVKEPVTEEPVVEVQETVVVDEVKTEEDNVVASFELPKTETENTENTEDKSAT